MGIDDLIREKRARAGNLPGLLIMYGAIVGLMALSALSIT